MSRQLAEHSRALSISWLKRQGAFNNGLTSGSVTWSYGSDSTKNSIGYIISIGGDDEYINLKYTFTNSDGSKQDMDYKIQLVSTHCNYGGKRYWFICPLTKEGRYCGRRVGVIYSIGKYFGCRHCGEIAYRSQMQSDRYKGFISIPDIEQAERKIKRRHYKDKHTKKYKKLMKMQDKFHWQLIRAAAKFDPKFKRIADLYK